MRSPSSPSTARFALSVLALGLLLAPVSGCSEEEEVAPPVRPPVAPIPRVRVAAPRPIASGAAFDLVSTPTGATLVWGAPSRMGGAIRLIRMDKQGAAAGVETTVFEPELPQDGTALTRIAPDAIEVAAGSGGGRMGVAWVARQGTRLRARVVHGPSDGESFGPPRNLGSVTTDSTSRGHLAFAASGAGDLRLVHQGGRGRCAGRGGRCAELTVRGVGRTGGRRSVPLAVPTPCEMAVTGFTFAGGSWYYGVCSEEEGSAQTTVFAVQFDPEYAHAEPLLEGCAPVGMVPMADGVVAVAQCGAQTRNAVRMRDSGRQSLQLGAVNKSVGCSDERPVLGAGGESGFTLVLDAPVGGVEALLPQEIAPTGSRAVWTGEAILIAVALDRDVVIRRYACEDGDFLRTNLP